MRIGFILYGCRGDVKQRESIFWQKVAVSQPVRDTSLAPSRRPSAARFAGPNDRNTGISQELGKSARIPFFADIRPSSPETCTSE
jgi:hypothetical protein